MKNDFDKMIKNIEEELLALKTAAEYTSIKSASYKVSSKLSVGLYRVEYQNSNEAIFSMVYGGGGENIEDWGLAYPRTPSGNTQVIELPYDCRIEIISNKPVVSITRIS